MCFGKAKVIYYTTFFECSEQLLFGTTSLPLYISLTKEDSCLANNYIFKVNNTKTIQKLRNVYKGYNKDTGAS